MACMEWLTIKEALALFFLRLAALILSKMVPDTDFKADSRKDRAVK